MNNNSFSFDNYDLIGFDLDNCLVEYDYESMSSLIYDILCRYLVVEKGYDKSLATTNVDFNFLQKGVFLDFERGNILKLSPQGKVTVAFHGTQRIEDIGAIYGEGEVWDHGREYTLNPLAAWNGPLSEKVRSVLDTFDLPACLVYGRLVDLVPNGSFHSMWQDIICGLTYMYDCSGFALNRGEYFPTLKSNPSRFVKVLPQETVQWLRDLKVKKGKYVCLITGSASDFASFTASAALGPNWRELFDLVIFFARKPAFFTETRPFVNEDTQGVCKLTDNVVNLSHGNWTDLQRFVSDNLGKGDLKCVYIGDNLVQDVFAPSISGCSDAIAICDRMINYGSSSTCWGSFTQTNGEPTFWQSLLSRFAILSVSSVNELTVL